MNDVASFIAQYNDAERSRISFAWNGCHAAEFQDANQEFRWQVVQACIAASSTASLQLLEHLFLADAEWSCEAWCAPHHFSELGGALLSRGQEAALPPFARGFTSSFDTFGACHGIQLPSELTARLLASATESLARASGEAERKPLEAVIELLGKLQKGNATQGWAKVEPGTPVSNVRLVWPRWYHKAWQKVSALWGGNAT